MRGRVTGLAIYIFVALVLSSITHAQFVEVTRVSTPAMVHDEWVTQVVASPTGKDIFSAGADGRVAVWDAATGKLIREVFLPSVLLTITSRSDARTIAVGDATGKVSLIDVESGAIKNSFNADKQIVNATAWSPDGQFLAAGGDEGIVRVWSMSDGKIVREINPAKGTIVALAFANSQIVIGTIDFKSRKYSVDLWDWENQKVLRSFDEGAPAFRGITVSPDGKLLAIARYRPSSLFFMLPTGEGTGFEASLRILPDSDERQAVGLWDVSNGRRLTGLDAETGARAMAFSPNGQMIATSGANGAIIFDVASGTYAEIGRIDSATSIDALAFSRDSQRVIIARQSKPMAQYGGEYALDKLTDPFFTNLVMTVREGTKPTFIRSKGAKTITGGSSLEYWQIRQLNSPVDLKTWQAVRAIFENRKDEGRKLLEQIIKEQPNHAPAQRIYAVLFETSEPKKAASRLEAAIKSDPNCVPCLRSLGDLQSNTEQHDKTISAYERVLQIKPEHGLVAGRLADTYGKVALSFISAGNTRQNMQAASNALGQALKLRPAEERHITNMASVAYFRGEFDTSIELLLLAQRLRPDHSRIYYNMGHSYREKGDKKKAIEAYKRYVQLGEQGEEARVERAKQLIKDLGGQ